MHIRLTAPAGAGLGARSAIFDRSLSFICLHRTHVFQASHFYLYHRASSLLNLPNQLLPGSPNPNCFSEKYKNIFLFETRRTRRHFAHVGSHSIRIPGLSRAGAHSLGSHEPTPEFCVDDVIFPRQTPRPRNKKLGRVRGT